MLVTHVYWYTYIYDTPFFNGYLGIVQDITNCTHNAAYLVKLGVVDPFYGGRRFLLLGDGRFLRRKQHELRVEKKFVHLHYNIGRYISRLRTQTVQLNPRLSAPHIK